MSRRFTGLCACGRRRPIRADGTCSGHALGRNDDCTGGRPIPGTERCGICTKGRYDYPEWRTKTPVEPIRHKLDCQQRTEQP